MQQAAVAAGHQQRRLRGLDARRPQLRVMRVVSTSGYICIVSGMCMCSTSAGMKGSMQRRGCHHMACAASVHIVCSCTFHLNFTRVLTSCGQQNKRRHSEAWGAAVEPFLFGRQQQHLDALLTAANTLQALDCCPLVNATQHETKP